MNCAEMDIGMIAYLDGKAGDVERHEVEAHLAACPVCAARAREFRALWGVLDGMPVEEPSLAFDVRLRARIAAEPARRGLWSWVPAPRLAFAVSLLLLLSAYISSRPQQVPPAPPAPPNPEAEFRMIKDLRVLEDYEVLANFEALSELPAKPAPANQEM